MSDFPLLLHTAIDTTDARGLAEFYRRLLGLRYRPGDEPRDGGDDDADWLVLLDDDGRRVLAIQEVERLERTTWPSHDVPMQLHIDFVRRRPRGPRTTPRAGRGARCGAPAGPDRRRGRGALRPRRPLGPSVLPAGPRAVVPHEPRLP